MEEGTIGIDVLLDEFELNDLFSRWPRLLSDAAAIENRIAALLADINDMTVLMNYYWQYARNAKETGEIIRKRMVVVLAKISDMDELMEYRRCAYVTCEEPCELIEQRIAEVIPDLTVGLGDLQRYLLQLNNVEQLKALLQQKIATFFD